MLPHCSLASDRDIPLHVGGELNSMVIDVSDRTIVSLFVTRHVNLMDDVAPSKKEDFTIKLDD